VLAPAITGIPELVDDRRSGFLYAPDSLSDFIHNIGWIHANQASLSEIRRRRPTRWPRHITGGEICVLSRIGSLLLSPILAVTMRILYCNKYDYPFSGTEAYLFDLIERMDRRGHQTALSAWTTVLRPPLRGGPIA